MMVLFLASATTSARASEIAAVILNRLVLVRRHTLQIFANLQLMSFLLNDIPYCVTDSKDQLC